MEPSPNLLTSSGYCDCGRRVITELCEPTTPEAVEGILLAIDNNTMLAKEMARELFHALPVGIREAFVEGFEL